MQPQKPNSISPFQEKTWQFTTTYRLLPGFKHKYQHREWTKYPQFINWMATRLRVSFKISPLTAVRSLTHFTKQMLYWAPVLCYRQDRIPAHGCLNSQESLHSQAAQWYTPVPGAGCRMHLFIPATMTKGLTILSNSHNPCTAHTYFTARFHSLWP